MDENVGKSSDQIDNAEWQSRPKPDAEGSNDFALASAGQGMTSSSAVTAKDEPVCTADGQASDHRILGHHLGFDLDTVDNCICQPLRDTLIADKVGFRLKV